MKTPENPYLVEKLKRFNVTDAEGIVLGSAESLVEALEVGRRAKELAAFGPNGPTSGVYVIDQTGLVVPINIS